MKYTEIPPAAPLRPFVRCFWAMRGRAVPEPTPERLFPDGTIEMVFNLSDAFEHHRDQQRAVRQPTELVVGQLVGPMMIAPTGTVDLVGIRFRSGGARPFFQLPLSDLTGRTCEVVDVCRPMARETASVLAALDDVVARVRILEGRLLEVLRSDPPVDELVLAGAELVEKTAGGISVDRLARELNLSSRQLERRFADAVGLPPKFLCRIVRFQRIFAGLDSDGPNRLSSLALRCGYYDQAHLNRDFRQFTGQSPTEFFAGPNELAKLFTGLET